MLLLVWNSPLNPSIELHTDSALCALTGESKENKHQRQGPIYWLLQSFFRYAEFEAFQVLSKYVFILQSLSLIIHSVFKKESLIS